MNFPAAEPRRSQAAAQELQMTATADADRADQ